MFRTAGPVMERPVEVHPGLPAEPWRDDGEAAFSEESLREGSGPAGVHAGLFEDPSVSKVLPLRLDDEAMASLAEADGLWASFGPGVEQLGLEEFFVWQAGGETDAPSLVGRPHEGPGQATLVQIGDSWFGTIHYENRVYGVRRLDTAAEDYVLVAYDTGLQETRLDRDDDFGIAPPPDGGQSSPLANIEIKVLVATTAAARNSWWAAQKGVKQVPLDSYLALLELQALNTAARESGVSGADVFVLAGGTVLSEQFPESGRAEDDATMLATGAGGASLRQLRDQLAADLVVLVTDSDDCGYAAAIGPSRDLAFATVSQRCLHPLYLTFSHEIGHLLGARHEVERDGENWPYPHQHGYHSPPGPSALRTLMAYNCRGVSNCPPIPRWSNPDKYYGSQRIGKPGESNNAAVLRANLAKVSQFR